MNQSQLQNVTVLGAGVLGGQIAFHSAYKGKQVVIFDISEDSLQRCRAVHEQYVGQYQKDLGASAEEMTATQQRLRYSNSLEEAVKDAQLVIEAVPEVPDIKISVYRDLAGKLPEATILATNSSTLLPSDFAEYTGRPEQYAALHFANLIWINNVVEIMGHPGTSDDTYRALVDFSIEIGMVPIPILKEQNAYVLNTWLWAMINVCLTLVRKGVATPEDIDRTYMISNRGVAYGPFGIIDIIGMKTSYDILNHWGKENQDEEMSANARYIKENFLNKGLQGMLGGKGFYQYPEPEFSKPDFLAVPDKSVTGTIVGLLKKS
ncbi:3-hydroxyacyl-CoA dehydrogenase [Microbulbifer guangxiensis]|uniref:3-hydroxyacyl-CoA dehydrogenase n=1 Tax=Microbulbifer guangxiensis TaxID=2904249 RepID=UPI001F00AF57|nr:3-hydroxyacyl-CoA dehydrogenase [Microbulbifer guangxiensis]